MIISAASNPGLIRSSHNFDMTLHDRERNHLTCCLPDCHSGPAVTPPSAGLPRALTAAWQHCSTVACMLPHADQYPASSPPAVACVLPHADQCPASSPPAVAGSGPAHHSWSAAAAARPACPVPAWHGLPELLTRQRLERVAAHGLLQAHVAELHQMIDIRE